MDVVLVADDGRKPRSIPVPNGVEAVSFAGDSTEACREPEPAASGELSGVARVHGEPKAAPGSAPAVADASRHDDAPGAVDPLALVSVGPESVDALVPLRPLLQAVETRPLAGTPADDPTARQLLAAGAPPAPLPLAPSAEKSSDAVVGPSPHVVERLVSAGTPSAASAVLQVDALVGSSNSAAPRLEARDEARPVAIALARTRELDVVTPDLLASASADGPVALGESIDGSGPLVFGVELLLFAGAFARVPGPLADVEPADDSPGLAPVELDAMKGSLNASVAGPRLPPFMSRS